MDPIVVQDPDPLLVIDLDPERIYGSDCGPGSGSITFVIDLDPGRIYGSDCVV